MIKKLQQIDKDKPALRHKQDCNNKKERKWEIEVSQACGRSIIKKAALYFGEEVLVKNKIGLNRV